MENDTKKTTNRRQFLKDIWKIAGVLALLQFTFVGISMFKSNKKKSGTENKNLFDAGNISDYKNNTITSFRANKFFIYRHSDGGFLALSVKCTHLGCAINWNNSKEQFICPCHSSHFDIKGNVLSAPASRPLDYLPITISNKKILVDTTQSNKRSSFSKKQLTYV